MNGYYMVDEMKNPKHALYVMIQMGVSPGIYSYTIIIVIGLCKNNCVDEAMNIEMREKNIVCNRVTYNSLINGLCKTSRISLNIFHPIYEMNDRG